MVCFLCLVSAVGVRFYCGFSTRAACSNVHEFVRQLHEHFDVVGLLRRCIGMYSGRYREICMRYKCMDGQIYLSRCVVWIFMAWTTRCSMSNPTHLEICLGSK